MQKESVFAVEVPASGAEELQFGARGDEALDGVEDLHEMSPVCCHGACADEHTAILVQVPGLGGGDLETPFQLGDHRAHEGTFLLQAVYLAEEDVELDPRDPHAPIVSSSRAPSRFGAHGGKIRADQRSSMGTDDHTNNAGNAVSRGADSVGDAVDDAKDSRTVRVVARAGFVALGLIHLLIGSIALGIALGSSGQADQSGAVGQMAGTPGGIVLLWAGLVACGVLALYMASDAVMGWSGGGSSKPWMNRLKAAGQTIVFAVAAVTFGSFALSHPSSSSEKSRSTSADLMSSTPGTVLLVIIGVALLAAAGTYVFLGITRKYEKNLRGKPSGLLGDAFTVLGVVGYCAKGVALGAVGLLILIATAAHDPSQQGGLDSALKAFLKQPFGAWVLVFVSLGLMAYGIFSLFRSRYQRI
jgi:hypothetical protein